MSQDLPVTIDPATAASLLLPGLFQYAQSGIVSRTLLATDTLRVVLFAIAPGHELTEHTSSRRALVQVLEGQCDFKFNGAWTRLGAGHLLHMPPGHAHAVRVGQERCAFLLVLHSDGTAGTAATTAAATEANA